MRMRGFIGASYLSQSLNVDCQRCMNLYPEVDPTGMAKEGEVMSLVSTPGQKLLVTLAGSPVRGMWTASNGTLYVAAGQYLYSISSSWTATQVGQLNSSSGYVSISDNGIQLVVVDGPDGYYVTLSTGVFAQITDANFLGANQVAFQDGYFIFNKPNYQSVYCSDLNAVTFSALNTGTEEYLPDNLVGLISVQENLYLFGTQSTEIWYDAGTFPFAFSRIQGAAFNTGCLAAFSIAKFQNSVFWVGGDDTGFGIVYTMQGYVPQKISTPAIEAVIRAAGSANVAGAKGWIYQQSGHIFYCLNIPTLNTTWVYDASNGLWHERTFLGSWGYERNKADCSAVAYGVNVVGDYESGNIYELDPGTLTDNGTSIVRMRTAPHLSDGLVYLFHHRFQLDMETGVGLSGSGQGTAPLAMLQFSDDGGHTWCNEKYAAIGPIGQTKTRVIWRRLGRSRDRVYRVMISDPVRVTLIGAAIDLSEGAA